MSHLVHLRIVGCAQDEKGLAVRQRKLVLLHLHSTLSEPHPNYPGTLIAVSPGTEPRQMVQQPTRAYM